jgi:Reverse transcriptase (RNA-dependent DNA polymerase)
MDITKKKFILCYKSIVSWNNFKIYKNKNIALDKLYHELKTQKYQPSILKKIQFFRTQNFFQQLYIFSRLDRLVYQAILIAIKSISNKTFLKEVYGFKDKKNLNDALKYIQNNWKNISWIISINLEKYFNNINFNFLLKWLANYFDQPTIELIRKLFNAGHLCSFNLKDQINYRTENIFLSLILANFYVTNLDNYIVNKLKPTYTKTERNKFVFMDSINKFFKRLYYVRYINNAAIGFGSTWYIYLFRIARIFFIFMQ